MLTQYEYNIISQYIPLECNLNLIRVSKKCKIGVLERRINYYKDFEYILDDIDLFIDLYPKIETLNLVVSKKTAAILKLALYDNKYLSENEQKIKDLIEHIPNLNIKEYENTENFIMYSRGDLICDTDYYRKLQDLFEHNKYNNKVEVILDILHKKYKSLTVINMYYEVKYNYKYKIIKRIICSKSFYDSNVKNVVKIKSQASYDIYDNGNNKYGYIDEYDHKIKRIFYTDSYQEIVDCINRFEKKAKSFKGTKQEFEKFIVNNI